MPSLPRFIYRCCRSDERTPRSVRPKNTSMNINTETIETSEEREVLPLLAKSVAHGSKYGNASPFVHATADIETAMRYLAKTRRDKSPWVCKIDTTVLGDREGLDFFDLSTLEGRSRWLPANGLADSIAIDRARSFSHKDHEVVVVGPIPASAVKRCSFCRCKFVPFAQEPQVQAPQDPGTFAIKFEDPGLGITCVKSIHIRKVLHDNIFDEYVSRLLGPTGVKAAVDIMGLAGGMVNVIRAGSLGLITSPRGVEPLVVEWADHNLEPSNVLKHEIVKCTPAEFVRLGDDVEVIQEVEATQVVDARGALVSSSVILPGGSRGQIIEMIH